jgi:ABC-2 type transport system ATP-binding protein
MRDGRLLADSTEAELLARTGTDDITDAFLALVDTDINSTGEHDG